ncbi:MAG TPA: ABC transporter permease [Gemmatimonadales bacterium]|jgi:predicted permease
MRHLRAILARIIGFFGDHDDRAIHDELQAHIEMETDENIRRGMSPAEARRQAIIASGGLTRAAEAMRDQRGLPWLEIVATNFRYAFRTLRKSPAFTSIVVLTIALGIGANAAIFSVFDQFLLRPVPVRDPGGLVNFARVGVTTGYQSCGQAGDCNQVFDYPLFRDLQRAQTGFTGIAAHVLFDANFSARGHALTGDGVLVSGNYFAVLGLHPALGRLLDTTDDQRPGDARVAVLSHDFWQTEFGGDPAILNQSLIVNGQSITVVGVAPRGFTGTTLGAKPRVFVPITLRELLSPGSTDLTERLEAWVYLFGRLKPGVSVDQATAGINVPYRAILHDVEAPLQQNLSPKTAAAFLQKQIRLDPGARGQSNLSRQAETPLLLLLAITALVLLIACANIANLLLNRGAARAGEMAVRLSIGGSRRQLVAQLLTEACLLGLMGGALSLLVARTTLGAMARLLPPATASTFNIHLDTTILAITAMLALVTAFAFGLFPALHATRPDLVSTLRGVTGQPAGGRGAARWRTSLATSQLALSMALLGAAGLFTKSLARINHVDLGLRIDHLVTFGISPELNGYTPERTLQFMQRLEDSLRQIPGVTGATASIVPLLAGRNRARGFDVDGFVNGPDVDNTSHYNRVGAGYFGTLGVPLIAGREFTRSDGPSAPKVAIVNEAFARKFTPGVNPIGRRMNVGNGTPRDVEIVGLVRNAKYSEVRDDVPPQVFFPYAQDPGLGAASFYVRTSQDPDRLIPMIPRVLARLDPGLPVQEMRTMPEQIEQNVYLDRFIGDFSAAFAILATLIAAIGLYGVLAQTVTQRTREIGVRMALGAAPGRVRVMILRQVGVMIVVGGGVGIAAAVGLGRLAQSQLYRMNGYDPAVLATAAITLSLVALGAGLIPAVRASRVEPMRALRAE